jgi:hypothetical protein
MEALRKTKGVNLTHGGILLIALMSGGDYAKVSSPREPHLSDFFCLLRIGRMVFPDVGTTLPINFPAQTSGTPSSLPQQLSHPWNSTSFAEHGGRTYVPSSNRIPLDSSAVDMLPLQALSPMTSRTPTSSSCTSSPSLHGQMEAMDRTCQVFGLGSQPWQIWPPLHRMSSTGKHREM